MKPLVKKTRKPRGIKLDGTRSKNLCSHCLSYNCDPMTMSHAFSQKITRRDRAGLCRSCGQKSCVCKSQLGI